MNIYEYLNKFDKFTKDPTLDAMKWLMNEFDNPHKNLKFIHVAGTNGKGSICEMLSNILIEAGYKVGKFISPQLIKFNETTSVNHKDISDEEVQEILTKLSKKIDIYNKTHETPVKWFEVITSLALIYFAKQKCDIVVLETGLGGTTDCTNIVDSIISVIANIGYDHMDVLGNTLEEITMHKAGIIKPNSNTVMFYQDGITPIIEKVCKERNTSLHVINKEDVFNYSFDLEYQKFNYKNFKDVCINLKGEKQIYNAAVCLECVNILNNLGYAINESAIKNGLKTVIHKARFQQLSKDPLIIFDGGHNENAIKNLKNTIKQYYPNKKVVYIISILKTKDYKTVLKLLLQEKEAVFIFTSGNDENRYVSKEDLYNEATMLNINNNLLFKENLISAIEKAKLNYKDNLIFIAGSFYVYGTVVDYLSK